MKLVLPFKFPNWFKDSFNWLKDIFIWIFRKVKSLFSWLADKLIKRIDSKI